MIDVLDDGIFVREFIVADMNLSTLYKLGKLQISYNAEHFRDVLPFQQLKNIIDIDTITRNIKNNHLSNFKMTADKTNFNDNELITKNYKNDLLYYCC